MVLIFSQNNSIRLKYVLDFCLKSKGEDYLVTQSEKEFEIFEGIKINYSSLILESSLTIIPEGLIDEIDLRESINIEFNIEEEKWLISGIDDPFAVIFYFLTSYEEYQITERDIHDRFSSKNSVFTKWNRLHIPNTDVIVKSIWQGLKLDYNQVLEGYKSIITFDIDSAWAVKNKSTWRNIGGDIKLKLKGESLTEKKQIRKGSIADPFDTFDFITELSKSHIIKCFFLLGNWGKFDKNIHWKNKKLTNLIKELSESIDIGIHPSYKSYLNSKLVKMEIERLRTIQGDSVNISRQHFLKLKLPTTYEILNSLGIKEDYSMGFADAYGFRSGTCFSYPFFNLRKNTISKLSIFPITYMDGTLNQYLKLTPADSIKIIGSLKNQVKDVGGLFIPLWHNETIGESGIWKGWKCVFEANF